MLTKTNVFNLSEAKGLPCKISKWMVNRVSVSVKALTQCQPKTFPIDYLERVKELAPPKGRHRTRSVRTHSVTQTCFQRMAHNLSFNV